MDDVTSFTQDVQRVDSLLKVSEDLVIICILRSKRDRKDAFLLIEGENKHGMLLLVFDGRSSENIKRRITIVKNTQKRLEHVIGM